MTSAFPSDRTYDCDSAELTGEIFDGQDDLKRFKNAGYGFGVAPMGTPAGSIPALATNFPTVKNTHLRSDADLEYRVHGGRASGGELIVHADRRAVNPAAGRFEGGAR